MDYLADNVQLVIAIFGLKKFSTYTFFLVAIVAFIQYPTITYGF